MKDAMWAVDPLEGVRYVGRTEEGQEVLFSPDPETIDTSPLLAHLRERFRDGLVHH